MIKNYYKISASMKINAQGVNDKGAVRKLLTRGQYRKAIRKLKCEGFIYCTNRKCWRRVYDDGTYDIVYFTDYVTEEVF